MMIEEEEEQIQHSNGSTSNQLNEINNNNISQGQEYYLMNPNQHNRIENMSGQISDLNNNFQYCQSYDIQQSYFQNNSYQHHSPKIYQNDNGMQSETPSQCRMLQKQLSNRKSSKKGILGVFENGNQQGSDSSNLKQQKFKSFWHIRFSKDYQEILKQNLNDENCLVNVCEPQFYNSHIKLRVLLYPQQGVFSGATIRIYFIVTKDYPYKPVLAFAEEYYYHPNINNNTKQIYWKILDDREWKPTLTLYFIILQLKFAFLEPDLTFVPNNIENVSCAELFQCNQLEFRRKFEIFYQSNDTSTLEKDLSNKMNLEEIMSEGSEKDFSTLNQLEYQFNRNTNLGIQSSQLPRSVQNYNQQNLSKEPFKSVNSIDVNKKIFEGQSIFGNNLTFNNSNNIGNNNNINNNLMNKNTLYNNQNNFENITVENYKGDFNFNQQISHIKHSPNINQYDNNNKNLFDIENNNFENHLTIAFTNNNTMHNELKGIFSNNLNNNIMENCGSAQSVSSSASVEQDLQSNQRMDQENFGSIYNKLQIMTQHLSPNQNSKQYNNETLLTPTLKKDREQSIRNQFQVDEPFNEDCEEVLLSGDSNSQSKYLFIQNPFNSQKEQSLLITSLLDTTSCQMHPKKRKYQNFSLQEDCNIFDIGKQSKLM